MKIHNIACLVTASLSSLASTVAFADFVVTSDGSELRGEILEVSEGKLLLQTEYAGTLEVALDSVDQFGSEDAESVRLDNGNVLVGPVNSEGPGVLVIETDGGAVRAATTEVASLWAPEDRDPAVVAREAEFEGQMRKWAYQATAAIGGKSGNTETTSIMASAAATLEGPIDRLDIYASYEYGSEESEVDGETIDTRSADEAILGMAYTSFFSEHWGWYIREEVEYDTFENIEFRSTTAGGLTYLFFDTPTHGLEGRAGVSYRYESYRDLDFNDDGIVDLAEADDSSEGYPGLDFGLTHFWQFAEWGEMNNSLTYTPSIADFADYLIDHESSIDIPLGSSDFWKLRLGLSNQYNSNPTPGREKLDTTYALSLLLNWR